MLMRKDGLLTASKQERGMSSKAEVLKKL